MWVCVCVYVCMCACAGADALMHLYSVWWIGEGELLDFLRKGWHHEQAVLTPWPRAPTTGLVSLWDTFQPHTSLFSCIRLFCATQFSFEMHHHTWLVSPWDAFQPRTSSGSLLSYTVLFWSTASHMTRYVRLQYDSVSRSYKVCFQMHTFCNNSLFRYTRLFCNYICHFLNTLMSFQILHLTELAMRWLWPVGSSKL